MGKIETVSTESFPSTGTFPRPAIELHADVWGAQPAIHEPQQLDTSQLNREPEFNSLHISRLQTKVDGITEQLFIAILNGEAVGTVTARIQEWKACAIKVLFVSPKHRHIDIATRLMQNVEAWARTEKATQLELCVQRSNTPARQFYIHRCKFIDIPDDSEGMMKAL